MFAKFDEIPSRTLEDIKETVYTKAIKNYKGNKKLAASKAYSIPPAMWSCWNIAKFKTL